MDIRLTEQVKLAHERVSAIEKKMNGGIESIDNAALLERIVRLEGELKAMKMRMGKKDG